MEALSLEKEPLRFILPLYISETNTQEIRYVYIARTRSEKAVIMIQGLKCIVHFSLGC